MTCILRKILENIEALNVIPLYKYCRIFEFFIKPLSFKLFTGGYPQNLASTPN